MIMWMFALPYCKSHFSKLLNYAFEGLYHFTVLFMEKRIPHTWQMTLYEAIHKALYFIPNLNYCKNPQGTRLKLMVKAKNAKNRLFGENVLGSCSQNELAKSRAHTTLLTDCVFLLVLWHCRGRLQCSEITARLACSIAYPKLRREQQQNVM